MEEKYRKLFELSYPDFLTFLKEINPDQLDFQVLTGFLTSSDFLTRDMAQMLLLTYFPSRLSYEKLLGFLLESPNLDVQFEVKKILDKRNTLSVKTRHVLELFI